MNSLPVTPTRTTSCPAASPATPPSAATVAVRLRQTSLGEFSGAAGGAGGGGAAACAVAAASGTTTRSDWVCRRLLFESSEGGGGGGRGVAAACASSPSLDGAYRRLVFEPPECGAGEKRAAAACAAASGGSKGAVAVSRDGPDAFSSIPPTLKGKIFSYLSGMPLEEESSEPKRGPDGHEAPIAIKVTRSWQLCQLSRAFCVDFINTLPSTPFVREVFNEDVSTVPAYKKASFITTHREMLKLRHIYSPFVLKCPELFSPQIALSAAVHYELYGLKKLRVFSAENKIFAHSSLEKLAQRVVRLMGNSSWNMEVLRSLDPELILDSNTLFPFALSDPKKLIQANPGDERVVDLILQIRPQLFRFASESLRGFPSPEGLVRKDWVMRALSSQSEWLEGASDEVQKAHPSLLKYTHPDMRKDPLVVLKAVELDPRAVAFCLEFDFKGYEDWLRGLVRKCPSSFKEVSRVIPISMALITELVFEHPSLVLDLEEPFSSDKGLLKLALNQDPSIYQKLREDLKEDRELAELVVQKDPNMYICLPWELKEIFEIAHGVLSKDGTLYRHLPESLLDNEALAVAAVRATPEIADFIEAQGFFSAEFLLEKASIKVTEE